MGGRVRTPSRVLTSFVERIEYVVEPTDSEPEAGVFGLSAGVLGWQATCVVCVAFCCAALDAGIYR